MNCRHCNHKLSLVFADLATCPPANAMLTADQLQQAESHYPLKVMVCDKCFLVQAEAPKNADEIFNEEYTYYSSYSPSWLQHARKYVEKMISTYHYNEHSLVLEIASNDGYLLQYFKEHKVPVLGIDPSANTAAEAIKKGIPTVIDFFGTELAKNYFSNGQQLPNLIIGNNVLAHVPNINDLVKGMKIALAPNGLITMEFPHLLNLVNFRQFDTIYHEHFSYLSFTAVKNIFASQGLTMVDVEELPTHGGSLRIYAKHDNGTQKIAERVNQLIEKEQLAGITTLTFYTAFQERIDEVRNTFTKFLLDQHCLGKQVIGYGAAAKGNTLINYAGIKGNSMIKYVVDASPFKQNKFLPASRIPVYSEKKIRETRPDYVIILPWNLQKEISNQLDYIREWGGQFVTFIPSLSIF